ncbi:purine nucleoside phosphorylase [Neofusicoccum parvum]|uniref:Purine nucleoside phosphorylase n=1 Tax=Neofusicoccum parvum TaxID=310453 RepID=A0ACB5SQF1_9PEZI|nr:purine nucleoside phosphorylase [Neofusicoccum parvum]
MRTRKASIATLGLLQATAASSIHTQPITASPRPLLNFSSPAPYIFSSINGLFEQWANTFFPNGHTIAACEVPAHTLFYHGRHDTDMPPSPEFLAFDVEMAYGIMGNLPDSRMLTYRTTRPVKCLYFDGTSANLMSAGVEAQMTFLEPFREVANWMWFTAAARHYGASGTHGIGPGRGEARSKVNTCGIFTFYDPGLEGQDTARIEAEKTSLNISTDGRWNGPEDEDSRAPALEQLMRRRRPHRANHVSKEDGKYMLAAVEERLRAVLDDERVSGNGSCSGIDWQLTTQEIVTSYSANIHNLLQALGNIPEKSEMHWVVFRTWLQSVRMLTHWFMMPFLEYPRGPYTNESLQVDFSLDSPTMQEAVERCQSQYDIEGMQQPQHGEQVLSWAVDETLGGICHAVFEVGLGVEHEWLSRFNQDPERHKNDLLGDGHTLEKGKQWRMAVEELMAWLGWAEQWTGCAGPCASNEICYIPMWPLIGTAYRLYAAPANARPAYPAMPSDDLVASARSAYQRAAETAKHLQNSVPAELRSPQVAIVCGSGLGGLADTIHKEPVYETPYASIPNFPQSTVAGHAGKLVFGLIGPAKLPVVLLVGRAHFYEGHTMDLVTFATRVCKVLGVGTMIVAREQLWLTSFGLYVVTNAAGGLNPDYAVGDIVCLNDHLNFAGLTGFHPLRGPNADEFGARFPPLSDAYDLELRQRVHKAWKKLGLDKGKRKLHEGVYAFVAGPTYETRAECRMLRAFGADVVGMSTVPEIVVARHAGIRVLAFSLVTNNAVLEAGPRGDDPVIQDMNKAELDAYLSKGKANHEEVLEAGREAAKDMQELVKQVLSDLGAA